MYKDIDFKFKTEPGTAGGVLDLVVNTDYTNNQQLWQNAAAVYAGVNEMITCRLISQHPRESVENWVRRARQAQHLNYSKGIIQAYTSHLFRKTPIFNYGALKDDPIFEMFLDDCDYEGTPFEDLWKESMDPVGLFGLVGYIVDAPAVEVGVVSDAIANKVHPYVSTYYAPAILDWQFIRNQWGQPILVYLKVLDDDGYLRCWWDLGNKIHWEVYATNSYLQNGRIVQDTTYLNKQQPFQSGDYDPKVMPEIPFVPHYNYESGRRLIGISDVADIYRCDINICNRLSDAVEIFEFASFPMMRKPWQRSGEEVKDEVGATAILEFDPEHPESKPDWLLAPVKDPVDAIIAYIEFIRKEVYRISAFAGMEDLSGNATGKSLNIRFQQLDAKLVKKANYAGQAMNGILRLTKMWMGKKEEEQDFGLQMPKDYNIEDLAQDIIDITSAETFVSSMTFSKELQKIVVQKMLPSLPEEVKNEILSEIESQQELANDLEIQQDGEGNPIENPEEQPPQENITNRSSRKRT